MGKNRGWKGVLASRKILVSLIGWLVTKVNAVLYADGRVTLAVAIIPAKKAIYVAPILFAILAGEQHCLAAKGMFVNKIMLAARMACATTAAMMATSAARRTPAMKA